MTKKEKAARREAMNKIDEQAVMPDRSDGFIDRDSLPSPYQQLIREMFGWIPPASNYRRRRNGL